METPGLIGTHNREKKLTAEMVEDIQSAMGMYPAAEVARIVKAVTSYEKDQATIKALLDALILALPYVETALEDKGYKVGAVDRMIKQIREAIILADGGIHV